jgi:PiT family inorganic phosphate transporter
MPPLWVILSCAVTIAAGTYLGGWRVIRTLGKGLVEIESPQGMAADTSSATIILLSSHFGYALSTTHVATGSILGSGVGRPDGQVRWAVAGRLVTAWLITLPFAAIVGASTYYLVHGIGGYAGTAIGFGLLIAVATGIWLKSRQAPITHENVTHEWQGNLTAGTQTSLEQEEAESGETLQASFTSDEWDDNLTAYAEEPSRS